MTRFQILHRRFWPNLTPREASDVLNEFEEELFTREPMLLHLSEKEQDDEIERQLEIIYLQKG